MDAVLDNFGEPLSRDTTLHVDQEVEVLPATAQGLLHPEMTKAILRCVKFTEDADVSTLCTNSHTLLTPVGPQKTGSLVCRSVLSTKNLVVKKMGAE